MLCFFYRLSTCLFLLFSSVVWSWYQKHGCPSWFRDSWIWTQNCSLARLFESMASHLIQYLFVDSIMYLFSLINACVSFQYCNLRLYFRYICFAFSVARPPVCFFISHLFSHLGIQNMLFNREFVIHQYYLKIVH